MLDCANENTPVRVSLVDRAQSTRFAFCDKRNSNYLTLMMSKSIKADVKIADSEDVVVFRSPDWWGQASTFEGGFEGHSVCSFAFVQLFTTLSVTVDVSLCKACISFQPNDSCRQFRFQKNCGHVHFSSS